MERGIPGDSGYRSVVVIRMVPPTPAFTGPGVAAEVMPVMSPSLTTVTFVTGALPMDMPVASEKPLPTTVTCVPPAASACAGRMPVITVKPREVQMPPLAPVPSAAASRSPAAEEAMAFQKRPLALLPAVWFAHVAPASTEVQMSPGVVPLSASTAASRQPSAEQVTVVHGLVAMLVPAVLFTQVAPESAEVQLSPPSTAATSRDPSAEEAMASHG